MYLKRSIQKTFELQLPSFTRVHESTPIELLDGQRIHLTQSAVGPQADWLAELHLFYLSFPELCRKCLCSDASTCNHPSYAELWNNFRLETAADQPPKPAKSHIPAELLAWHEWAQQKGSKNLLDRHQVQLCYGPMHALTAYDRISYGGVEIVATVQEVSKHARDSVIMLHDNDLYRAGRVVRFLVHTAPGCIPDKEHDTNIADVRLYQPVPDSHQAAKASSKALGCPIYKSNLVDEPEGNLWPILKLAPAKYWIVPHHSGQNHVVVLHRFASFRDLVPIG